VATVGDAAAIATALTTRTADTMAAGTSNASVRFIPASLIGRI
jgi:hypothetical protein